MSSDYESAVDDADDDPDDEVWADEDDNPFDEPDQRPIAEI